MPKVIAGRDVTNEEKPFKYISPIDSIIPITDNLCDTNITGELLANDSTIESEQIIRMENGTVTCLVANLINSAANSGLNRLCISADFRSYLRELGAVTGQYGLKVLIHNDEDKIYELILNCADMYGNPYQFDIEYNQSKIFDISSINRIKKMSLYFYQDGQFKDSEGNFIPCYFDNGIFGKEKLKNNIIVNNIKIYLGYDVNDFKEDTLVLYTPDTLTYHYKTSNSKKIYLRWIRKNENGKFYVVNDSNFDTNLYSIKWFQYQKGAHNIDKYGGVDWAQVNILEDNPFEYNFLPNIKKQTEQIKAIIIENDQTAIKDNLEESEIEQLGTPFFSSILEFKNLEYVPDQITQEASIALSITCKDNSEGNYFIYNTNGKIINEGLGIGYRRILEATYQGASLYNDQGICPYGTIDYINWHIPYNDQDTNTMILSGSEYIKENDTIEYNVLYNDTQYIKITKYPDKNTGIVNLQQEYSIANQWTQLKTNNTVLCEVSINGVIYKALHELKFGKINNTGSNNTFLIEFDSSYNALPARFGAFIKVSARLYDANGKRINITQEQEKNIEWSWMNPHLNKQQTAYMYLSQAENNQTSILPSYNEKFYGSNIFIISNVNDVPEDNYFILQAKYKNDSSILEAFLPIPMKYGYTLQTRDDKEIIFKDISHIEGAKEVIYNAQGIPTYYSDAYSLYTILNDYNKISLEENAKWLLKSDETTSTSTMAESYKLNLQIIPGREKESYGLLAPQFYVTGLKNKHCVSCSLINADKKTVIAWSQPILVMQSQYESPMINNWTGELQLDENNGTIMSTMFGAGHKNDNNTFSGVLVGNIKDTLESTGKDEQLGVYGLHEGEIAFSLRENGKAIFGKAGKGQIRIDGNEGTIKSQNYDENQIGMKIDLNKGIIDIQDKDQKYQKITTMTKEIFDVNDCYYILVGNNKMQYADHDWNYYSNLDIASWYILLETSSQVHISPYGKNEGESYFKIQSSNNNTIMNVDNKNYYLQSDNLSSSSGTKLDLSKGELDVRSPAGQVYISGGYTKENETLPYFKIAVPQNEVDLYSGEYKNNLFLVDANNYYLQSAEFGTQKHLTGNYNNIEYNIYIYNAKTTTLETLQYQNKRYALIRNNNENTGNANVQLQDIDKIDIHEVTGENTITNVKLIFEDKIQETIQPDDDQGENETSPENKVEQTILTAARQKQDFITYLNPILLNSDAPSGFKLNLKDSTIEGYSLILQGANPNNSKQTFKLSSKDEALPLSIGDNFKVAWDGSLICNNLSSLNNDGRDDLAISINNKFGIDKFGNVVGSTINGKAAELTTLSKDLNDLNVKTTALLMAVLEIQTKLGIPTDTLSQFITGG